MIMSSDAWILVNGNVVQPHVSKYLNMLRENRPEAFRHSFNVAFLITEMFLRDFDDELNLPIDEDIISEVVQGALLHDIGKLKISEEILLKPGPLTPAEREEMNKHPIYGYEMVKDEECLSELSKSIILQHHELPGGGGYPNNLAEVSNEVKLVALCDKYDALTENRSYRPKMDPYKALKTIVNDLTEDDLGLFLLLTSINDK